MVANVQAMSFSSVTSFGSERSDALLGKCRQECFPLGSGDAKVVPGLCVIGLEFQGLLEMGRGLVEPAEHGHHRRSVVVGIGVVGLDFQGLSEMGQGLVRIDLFGQGNSEVVVGLRVVGLDFHGLLVMGDGLILTTLFEQGHTEAVLGLGVVRGLGHCVFPDGKFALVVYVATEGENPECHGRQHRQNTAHDRQHRPRNVPSPDNCLASEISPNAATVTTAARGKYMRCSKAACPSGTKLDVGARIAKNHAPRKPHGGRASNAQTVRINSPTTRLAGQSTSPTVRAAGHP